MTEMGGYIVSCRLRDGLFASTNPRNGAKPMRQVTNRVKAEGQAIAESSPSPQIPHPRATQARTRGIKFPISDG